MTQNTVDEETIVGAVRRVMNAKPRIGSQREFASLVLKEIRLEHPEARLSTARLRRVAVSSGAVKLEIEYRESVRSELPDLCPVCGAGMSPIYNGTLDGKIAEIKRNCSVCPYTVGKNILVPGKYTFVRCVQKECQITEARIRKLKKAASMLRGASKLIGEALDGTNFPQRQDYAKDMIEEIVSSREMTGSIPNLIADIKGEEHSDPLWTKPLSSPKYPDRKDI